MLVYKSRLVSTGKYKKLIGYDYKYMKKFNEDSNKYFNINL